MTISFYAEDIELPAIKKEAVSNWIRKVAETYGKKTGDISYIFCSDEKILEVNRQYLQHDYYTDIITFDYTSGNKISGDLFISLDCGDERRLGFSEPVFQKAKETLCVDHHISNESFADTNYIVPDASSTSELVFRLLDEEKITEEIASFLYMGIVHDTGVFQYSCTSPETMEVGAALLRKGINGSAIIDGTYFEKSYVQNQMLGKALLESMMILNKKAVVSVIRLKEMEFFQAKPSDLDGIVSVLSGVGYKNFV